MGWLCEHMYTGKSTQSRDVLALTAPVEGRDLSFASVA